MTTTPDGDVTVRLFIFSGRPDPEWSLDEHSTGTLRGRVEKTLKGERIDATPEGGLGYRGFLVQNRAGIAGLPTEFTVFRRVLSEPRAVSPSNWRDDGDVETWLLAQARERGYGETLDAFSVGREEQS